LGVVDDAASYIAANRQQPPGTKSACQFNGAPIVPRHALAGNKVGDRPCAPNLAWLSDRRDSLSDVDGQTVDTVGPYGYLAGVETEPGNRRGGCQLAAQCSSATNRGGGQVKEDEGRGSVASCHPTAEARHD
jgi:hypothetical protein